MKAYRIVPAVMAIEAIVGAIICIASKKYGLAVYWLGAAIINTGIALM